MTEGKKGIFEEAVFKSEMRKIICALCSYGLADLGIILKRYFEDWSSKI